MGLELPITDVVLQFTIVVAAALVVQVTFERSRIPGIVGLLVLGMMLGPGGLALLPEEPVVELLGSIGLLYIMFIAGLEIDLDVVRRHKGEAISFGVLAFALSLVPAIGVGLLIGMEWAGAFLLGAALSSHTLLAYPIVERMGLVHHRPIVSAIGGTLLTDTSALLLLAIVIQQPGAGEGGALGWLTPLFLLGVLAALSLLVVPRLAPYVLQEGRATAAERALFLLAILLVLSAAADLIGTEDILGAFLAGVCLNRIVQPRQELRQHLEFVGRMLFIPFFFVETGMRLELEVFTERLDAWVLAGLLLAVVLLGKFTAAWLTGMLFGYGSIDRVAMASLSLPQAAATLAVVVTGRGLGLIGDEVVDAVIIVIFITCLAGPLLTGYAGRRLTRAA